MATYLKSCSVSMFGSDGLCIYNSFFLVLNVNWIHLCGGSELNNKERLMIRNDLEISLIVINHEM